MRRWPTMPARRLSSWVALLVCLGLLLLLLLLSLSLLLLLLLLLLLAPRSRL